MSLISQQDRSLVLKCLDFYIKKLEKDMFDDPQKRANIMKEKIEVQTLLNWIELEHYKHAD